MARTKPKTVLRSIRIPAHLEDLLRAYAHAKGISVSALVSAILTTYAEWNRFTEKFGFVTMTKADYRSMLESLDEAGVQHTSREAGSHNPREMPLFGFKKLGPDAFLGYLSLIGRYAKWGEVKVEWEGRDVTVLLHPDISPRFSPRVGHSWRGPSRKSSA